MKPDIKINIENIRADLGTNDMYIDACGQVRDKITNQLIAIQISAEAIHLEKKRACKEYFRSLPIVVRNELLKVALAHLTNAAVKVMNDYSANDNSSEKWSASYEELAKIAAEGILLGD